jgi:hypothetical protein
MLLLGDRELTLPKKTNGGPLFSTWELLRDAFIGGTLASTNINSLPAKQQCIYRPSAWPKHHQAHPQSRGQDVKYRVSGSKDYCYLDNRLQSPRDWGPQTRK